MGKKDNIYGSWSDGDDPKTDVHADRKTRRFNQRTPGSSLETGNLPDDNSVQLEWAFPGVTAEDGVKKSVIGKSCEDNGEGHLDYHIGLVMKERYEVVSTLGVGAFGKVVECIDRDKKDRVAVKIVRNTECFREVARSEIAVLEDINILDDDNRFSCVRMLDWFEHNDHICIVFELLGLSTFEFLRQNKFLPYNVEQIRHMAFQIFRAVCCGKVKAEVHDFPARESSLYFATYRSCDDIPDIPPKKWINVLHRNKLTHTDLKPENILFVCSDYDLEYNDVMKCEERKLRRWDVKVVDFGTAKYDHEDHESEVSTRHYRAPEVILGLGWNQSCDVWSLGCVLMEFYMGRTLFQTHDSKEHLAMMEKILGPIPPHLLKQTRKQHYVHNGRLNWDKTSSSDEYIWKHCIPLKSMGKKSEEESQLFDLIGSMLEYDVYRRLTLEEALWHPFFSPLRMQKPRS